MFVWSAVLVGQDTLTVDRLDYRFVSFTEGELLPLTSPENSEVAGLFISCQKDQQFEFCGASPFAIWVDGRYVADSGGKYCLYISSEVLCAFANRDVPFLSVISEGGLGEMKARTLLIESKTKKRQNELLKRDHRTGYWILGFLIACVLLIVVQLFGPSNNWRFQRPNLREFSSRFFTQENMILLFLLAIVNAFCYSSLTGSEEVFFIFQSLVAILQFWMAKAILILLSGAVFGNSKIANWQLIFQLQFWLGVSLLIFVFIFSDFIFFADTKLSSEKLLIVMAFGALVFLFLTGTVLMTQKGRKKLHIFIYLCTTEILPITLLVYWFLK